MNNKYIQLFLGHVGDGKWGNFTECDVTCGVGSRYRNRTGNKPPPQDTHTYTHTDIFTYTHTHSPTYTDT